MFDIVYFSSTSENTKRFVDKLGLVSRRIPLLTKDVEGFHISTPSVLVLPTYGGGEDKRAVPIQVIKFLNDPVNRSLIVGVIATGNTNFGTTYAVAGDIVSAKLQVPLLYRVEILGTPNDIFEVKERLQKLWDLQQNSHQSPAFSS
ncbi:MAG: class Ib ribonucleoside-diphosphate reductase assembly flavoprotein NrdI [Actinomycetales bacterium]|nr:class Ib ribonucleoside-diphosphate reductase assembly flavoprotein NrdI [Actinomycetales bacterium]